MRTINKGYIGKELDILKRRLLMYGYDVSDADFFNNEVYEAVVNFQKAHGLDSDGIVGYYTWEALFFSNRESGLKITDDDFEKAALLLDVETAVLKAVEEVETSGKGGFLSSGRPTILFEGHVFWAQLKKRKINPEKFLDGNEDILYPKWTKSHYKGGESEYDRLDRARKINKEAADSSASWGMFQVMGYNYKVCGEKSVEDFVKMMSASELHQLLLSIRFIRSGGMLPSLQKKDWVDFARRYNGPSYKENKYDEKLAAAYRRFS